MHIGNDVKAEEVSNDEYNKWSHRTVVSMDASRGMAGGGCGDRGDDFAAVRELTHQFSVAVRGPMCSTSEVCGATVSDRCWGVVRSRRVFVRRLDFRSPVLY